mgnify:CR=1 FL=1
MEKVLEVKNIEKYYGNKSNLTKAINNISFNIDKGEFVGIMGASGSGKTTLLNCIATIDKVTAGKILINNQEAQTILYSLLFAKKSSDDYKAGTILWRLTRMGSSVAAIDLGKAIDEGRIDTIEFKNRSEAVFYCFELGKCLGFDMKSDLTIYNKWKFLENIISKEVSIKANKVCTRIKDEM